MEGRTVCAVPLGTLGYKIECGGCLEDGVCVKYDGEAGRNAYSRGLDHQGDLPGGRRKTLPCGNTVN